MGYSCPSFIEQLSVQHIKMKFAIFLVAVLLVADLNALPMTRGKAKGDGKGIAGRSGVSASGSGDSKAEAGSTSTVGGQGKSGVDQLGNVQAEGQGAGLVNGGLGATNGAVVPGAVANGGLAPGAIQNGGIVPVGGAGNTAAAGNGNAGPGGANGNGVAISNANNGGSSQGVATGFGQGDQFGNFQAGGNGQTQANGGLLFPGFQNPGLAGGAGFPNAGFPNAGFPVAGGVAPRIRKPSRRK